MLAAQFGLTLLLLAVCSLTPGFFVVRRLRWNPLEKLCGSISLSLIVVYLLCFGAYVFAPASLAAICRAFAAISVLLGLWMWREIRRLVCSFGVRQAIAGYGFLLLWTLAFLAIIHNYSGAGWSIDWDEHFQRTLFFLHRFPVRTIIGANYKLPARPPMMNILGAFFLAQTADRFEIFQLVFAFLNLLLFFPCCLITRELAGKRAPRTLPLVALLAMNPMLMENVTYTWTKALTVFFVLFALWLYLAGIRKNDGQRIIAAYVSLTAGLLVHYSAGPYLAFLGLHYLIAVFRKRPHRFREISIIACLCGFLLTTWFGWSLSVYGTHDTFASNTSITYSSQYHGSTLGKIAGNLFDSVVPAIFRNPDSLNMFDQPNKAGQLRDNFFVIYQTNLVFAMGLVGGPVAIWLFFRAMRRFAGRERQFWLYFVPFVAVAGIAVVGERDELGVAHLTLISLETLGIALVAASFPWRRWTAIFLIGGCIVDFSLGVFLQAHVEGLDNTPRQTVFNGFSSDEGYLQIAGMGRDTLSRIAWGNWYIKNKEVLDRDWQQRMAELPRDNPEVRRFARLLDHFTKSQAPDLQGWYARNGGMIAFLGDRLAKPSVNAWNAPSVVFLLMFAGLLAAFARQSTRLAPIDVAQPTTLRKRAARKPN